MKSLISGITALMALALATTASAESRTYNLLLAGSELEICSSMNAERCLSDDWIEANEMRTSRLFQLTDVRRKEALRSAIWPSDRADIRGKLSDALEQMAEYFGRGVVPEQRFVERFRGRAHLPLLMELSEAEYERVLDNLELRRLDGLYDVANLAQSPASTREVINEFMSMLQPLAGRDNPPRIVLVTGAARDSFAAVERYVGAFEQAGAEVTWLPVDAVVTEAQSRGQCGRIESLRRSMNGTYDRDRVNPDLHARQVAYCEDATAWESIIENAHGVFFTHGRADRLRRAFGDEQGVTPLLRALQERFVAGTLVVAAEGEAINAMSRVNMLTNGSSREALNSGAHPRPAPTPGCELDNTCPRDLNADSLTYDTRGGLGFYGYGLVDFDTSYRGRQLRLMRLAQHTGTPVGVGIDRHTALQVNSGTGHFRVLGDEGVFMIQGAQGVESLIAGSFHYLQGDSTGTLSGQGVSDVTLAAQRSRRIESTTTRFIGDTGIIDSLETLCRRGSVRLLQDRVELLMRTGDDSEVAVTGGRCQVYNGVIGVAVQ
ncbi:MAG: hypothetical protein JJU10_03810 [Idiomarina sp.]|nr:hypothetical protein [Idiomarina sp.]